MSERDPQNQHSLDYRDPRADAPTQQFAVLRSLGSAFLVVLCVYAAIVFGRVNWDMRGAMVCGMLAIIAIAFYTIWTQKRLGPTAAVAGAWIGVALSLLLLGVCASIN